MRCYIILIFSHKRIKVSYSRPRTTEIKDTNLLINNVPSGRDVSQKTPSIKTPS